MVYTAILAVLPSYRGAFLEAVAEKLAPDKMRFAAGDTHLVPSVRSDPALPDVNLINRPLLGSRLLWQAQALKLGFSHETLVVDLNPRSITAWLLLVARRCSHRRTIAWGHIHPRAGANAPTAPLRDLMICLSDGIVCYTYADREELRRRSPSIEAWVAPNGLYRAEHLSARSAVTIENGRTSVVYVGRLEEDKKPMLLIEAFSRLDRGPSSENLVLEIVGDGTERARCEQEAHRLGIAARVRFHGSVNDLDELSSIYSRAFCSVSPGYAGLSLTQSLGFGVPMVVARDEPHAPEIELLSERSGYWFESDSSEDLAVVISMARRDAETWERRRPELVAFVTERYSADAMARGFVRALKGEVEDQ